MADVERFLEELIQTANHVDIWETHIKTSSEENCQRKVGVRRGLKTDSEENCQSRRGEEV
jgi:hypothetical protein